MNDTRQRSCRGCGESGHNIRSCVTDLDKQLIEEYSLGNFIPVEFPPPRINIGNKLNKLCQKYGLSITNITDNQKKERLHNIYVCLGRQHLRNTRNQLYLQQRQIHLYRPTYLPPPLPVEQRRSRFLNYLSLYYLQNNNREPAADTVNRKKPSLQIIVNPSKFTQKTDVLECPICYEECCNMLVTDCNHSYCQPCISTLITSVNKTILPCPLCRENIKNVFVFSETSSDLMLQI